MLVYLPFSISFQGAWHALYHEAKELLGGAFDPVSILVDESSSQNYPVLCFPDRQASSCTQVSRKIFSLFKALDYFRGGQTCSTEESFAENQKH